jgi:hypothetical protein
LVVNCYAQASVPKIRICIEYCPREAVTNFEQIFLLGPLFVRARRGRRQPRNPETFTDPPTDRTIVSRPLWSI